MTSSSLKEGMRMVSDSNTAHWDEKGSVELHNDTLILLSPHCRTWYPVSMVHLFDSRKSNHRTPSVARPSATMIWVLNTVWSRYNGSTADPRTDSGVPSTLTSCQPFQGDSSTEDGFTRSHASLWRRVTAAPVSMRNDMGFPWTDQAWRNR